MRRRHVVLTVAGILVLAWLLRLGDLPERLLSERGDAGPDRAARGHVSPPGPGAMPAPPAEVERRSYPSRPTLEEFQDLFDRYRRAALDGSLWNEAGQWEAHARRQNAAFAALLQNDPRLEDYPFLDPLADAPANPEFLLIFSGVLAHEVIYLQQGMYWSEQLTEGASPEWSRKASLAKITDPERLAFVPPSFLASMPWFGEVSEEDIVEWLPTLQDLRLEYLDAVYPYLLEKRLLESWWHRQESGRGYLPEEFRVDVGEHAEARLAELEALMEPHRVRYLRAVGETIGASELPPID